MRDRQVEILKSQLAAKFPMYNGCTQTLSAQTCVTCTLFG